MGSLEKVFSERMRMKETIDNSWWETQKQKYRAGEIPAAELFPTEEESCQWSLETRRRWRKELLAILEIDIEQLRASIPELHFRYWGPTPDGEIGWLTPPDFLEDTDLPYEEMYPGMTPADYQHGWCLGMKNFINELTKGKHALMITNLGEI